MSGNPYHDNLGQFTSSDNAFDGGSRRSMTPARRERLTEILKEKIVELEAVLSKTNRHNFVPKHFNAGIPQLSFGKSQVAHNIEREIAKLRKQLGKLQA